MVAREREREGGKEMVRRRKVQSTRCEEGRKKEERRKKEGRKKEERRKKEGRRKKNKRTLTTFSPMHE